MNTQTLAVLLCLLLTNFTWAQDFDRVDAIVLSYPSRFSSASKLADRIASDFTTDLDKVRATYTWITNNVIYDPKEKGKGTFKVSSKTDFEKRKRKAYHQLSSRVISKGKAVCYGYSVLFKVVCNEMGIPARVVAGSSKRFTKDIGKRFYADHGWNVVQIGSEEYLVDATWGAGYYKKRFFKQVDYFYFLTDPKLFIRNHYPEHYVNALLAETIEREEFLNAPLYYSHDYKLKYPMDGIIKKDEVGKVTFRFETDKKVVSIFYEMGKERYEVETFENNGSLEFELDLSCLERERELVFFFNFEAAMAFRIR